MLIIRNPGHRSTLHNVAPGAFTRANFGGSSHPSARITSSTPDGVLGGMWAKMSGNYEVDIVNGNSVVGLFLNDAVGSPFENTPAVASGKITVMVGQGEYETDIYETTKEDTTALATAWSASIGLPLYVSDFGLLTTENTGTPIVGYVTKAPSTGDPFLGFRTVL